MRDKLLKFGKAQAATKATEVYCADIIDFGSDTQIGNLDNFNIVIAPTSDMNSADTVYVKVYDGSAAATQSNLILSGPAVCLKKGEQSLVPFPKKHQRYVKIGIYPASTGTFTATDINVWCQFGHK